MYLILINLFVFVVAIICWQPGLGIVYAFWNAIITCMILGVLLVDAVLLFFVMKPKKEFAERKLALEKGETFGACLGTVCGLIQDAFSLGVFGVAGLSKTIMGFLAGYVSKKLDMTPFFRKFLFILVLLSLEFVLWAFLSSFIFSEKLLIGRTLHSFQPVATAILGSLIFLLLKQIKKFSSQRSA